MGRDIGIGARVMEIEENILKVWILLNWDFFPINPKDSERLKEIIKSYFKYTIRDISFLQRIIKSIEKVCSSSINDFDDWKLEVVENGGAHCVTTPRGSYTYPDPTNELS